MWRASLQVAMVMLVVGGCSKALDPAGTETDPSVGTDTDGSTGNGSDTDSDTGSGGSVDCNADYTSNMTKPLPSECVTEELTCGKSVLATTSGGNNFYDFADYEAVRCIGRWSASSSDYSGPERIFKYSLDAGQEAHFTFESPCNDIKVTKINNPTALDECPVYGGPCDSKPRTSDDTDNFVLKDAAFQNPLNSILVVESPEGVATNFKVTMECFGG